MTKLQKYFGSAALLRKIFALALPLCAKSALAVEVSGTVADDRTGKPIAGALVAIPQSTVGASTDPSGRFSIHTGASLPVTIVVSMVGYASQEVEVYDLDAPLRVLLTEDVSYIEEVVVVGYGT
ncbi:MAG: carboxypeptidase-like regulatory domain-containing protein, partial [Prevotellaceae bacterium]|nr:carboxypeptidase-like regulatory domain-containing protein [Prevotellaceae bacterium]